MRRLRQLICIHGPIDHVPYLIVKVDGEYARDICRRCGAVTLRYNNG